MPVLTDQISTKLLNDADSKMNWFARRPVVCIAAMTIISFGPLDLLVNAQQSQNPSPMQEQTRAHIRVQDKAYATQSVILKEVLSRPVEIFIPACVPSTNKMSLLFHFHGADFVVDSSIVNVREKIAGLSINLGAGSGVYGREFTKSGSFQALYDSTVQILQNKYKNITIDEVILSGFSAGYGAVRSILADENRPKIDRVLLLDGIHAGYIPPGTGLYYGGKVDSTDLLAFNALAEKSMEENADAAFLITHSEIFPGTYVSTTEATDYILGKIGIAREPVLRWGPGGMQQLSIAEKGRFRVLGFAGNTAPDHMDHLHNLPTFLNELLQM